MSACHDIEEERSILRHTGWGGGGGGGGELGKINPNIREKAMWPQGKHFFLNLIYVSLEVQARKSIRLNSSHANETRMPSSA